MADFIMGAGDQGIYEIPLTAGVAVTISVPGGTDPNGLTVLVHSGSTPIYADFTATLVPKDSKAKIIFPAGAWASIPPWRSTAETPNIFAVVSASSAVVSVFRA